MPFKKGDPNINRKGPPVGHKRKFITEIALRELAKKMVVAGERGNGNELILRTGIKRAIKGDYNWAKFVFSYAHGLPAQQVEITGEDGGPIRAGMSKADFERGLSELGYVKKENQ